MGPRKAPWDAQAPRQLSDLPIERQLLGVLMPVTWFRAPGLGRDRADVYTPSSTGCPAWTLRSPHDPVTSV